jgi:hypothetical protein
MKTLTTSGAAQPCYNSDDDQGNCVRKARNKYLVNTRACEMSTSVVYETIVSAVDGTYLCLDSVCGRLLSRRAFP